MKSRFYRHARFLIDGVWFLIDGNRFLIDGVWFLIDGKFSN